MQISVFNYNNSSDLLRDLFISIKSRNPAFSLRAFARKLGLKGHSHLSRIINGKKKCPMSYVPMLASELKLNNKETNFLELLLSYESAKGESAKKFYLEKIKKLTKKDITFLEVENFQFWANPLCTQLLDLMDLKHFQSDLKWIQEQLLETYYIKEIQRAMEILVNLHLVRENEGQYIKVVDNVGNRIDVPNKAIRAYHREKAKLAINSIDRDPIHVRDVNSYSLAVKKKDYQSAKEDIQNFVRDFLTKYQCTERDGELLYSFNVHFYPNTKDQENQYVPPRPSHQ